MTIDYLIDFIFFIDILLNFRTTALNKFGDEIYDPKIIAKFYFFSFRFWMDVICIFEPMYELPSAHEIKIFKILKINAISRFSKIIESFGLKEENKALVKILWYFFLFLIYMHFMSCIWFYIVHIREIWIPPLNYDAYKKVELYDNDFLY